MKHLFASRRIFGVVIIAMAMLLVACGNDDEPAPTATSAAPVGPAVEGTPGGEVVVQDLTIVTPDSPSTSESVPATATGVEPTDIATASAEQSEPVEASTAVEETVEATPTDEQASVRTESTPEQIDSPLTGSESYNSPGDGTGGSGMPGERNSSLPESATPVASPVALLTVEGCEVPDVPAFAGDVTTFTTVAEINFRSGPGVECDPVLDQPLAEGMTVEVLGGPVTQGLDDTEWVQIEIDGVPGWISTDFIEPAE